MSGTLILSRAAAIFLLTGVALAASPQDLLASGHVDEAVQVLEQQVRQSPNDAAGYNLLCRAYFMIEEWDRGTPTANGPASRFAKQLSLCLARAHLWREGGPRRISFRRGIG